MIGRVAFNILLLENIHVEGWATRVWQGSPVSAFVAYPV